MVISLELGKRRTYPQSFQGNSVERGIAYFDQRLSVSSRQFLTFGVAYISSMYYFQGNSQIQLIATLVFLTAMVMSFVSFRNASREREALSSLYLKSVESATLGEHDNDTGSALPSVKPGIPESVGEYQNKERKLQVLVSRVISSPRDYPEDPSHDTRRHG